MFVTLHKNKNAQIVLGLPFGIMFGFLLQKGGATDYNVITGQLQFTDFTVLKLMLSAVIVGMIGFHLLKHFGHVRHTQRKDPSVPMSSGVSSSGSVLLCSGIARERLQVRSGQERSTPFLGAWSGF